MELFNTYCKKTSVWATALVSGAALCGAADYNWSGAAGDGTWGTSGNWTENGSSNGYYPQSDSDAAIIGENCGEIIWSSAQGYFGATNTITLGKGSTLKLSIPNNGTGDLSVSVLNLYGTVVADVANALGFQKDFSVNFGEITGTQHGFFDLSGVTGTLWGNSHSVSVSASATVSGEGALDLFKFGTTDGAISFSTTGIGVSAADGSVLTLNADASSLDALDSGEYAIVASGASNGGLSILYKTAAIPEPSVFGMIFGAGTLAFAVCRRRRKNG